MHEVGAVGVGLQAQGTAFQGRGVTIHPDQTQFGAGLEECLGVASQSQGAVHQYGAGTGQGRCEQFHDAVEHDRHVKRVDTGSCGPDPGFEVPLGRVFWLCPFFGTTVPPDVPHAFLLHAVAVSPSVAAKRALSTPSRCASRGLPGSRSGLLRAQPPLSTFW